MFFVATVYVHFYITMKNKDIQGPSLICKTMHHIFQCVSFSIANKRAVEKYAADYCIKQFGSA